MFPGFSRELPRQSTIIDHLSKVNQMCHRIVGFILAFGDGFHILIAHHEKHFSLDPYDYDTCSPYLWAGKQYYYGTIK